MGRLLTVGHGTLDRHGLAGLLTGAGTDLLVDIRRFPNSRHNPDVSGDALAEWLPQAGIDHRWDERLGGRRRLTQDDDREADSWWRVEAFRAYAAHTRTPEFLAALDDLAADVAARTTTVIMCSESVWWRCHRRLIADVLVSLGIEVLHIQDDSEAQPHNLAEPGHLVDGILSYGIRGESPS